MIVDLRLRCPRCHTSLSESSGKGDERNCPACEYRLRFTGEFWDGRIEGDPPADFAAQWRLWEAGELGGPMKQLYGKTAQEDFASVMDLLGLSSGDLAGLRILEVGFGHGRILRELQNHCPHACGVDLARPLPSAQLNPRSIVLGSLFTMPWAPGQFDLVICRGVIHSTPDVRLAFTRIAEQVAPGGRLYLYIYEHDVPRSLLLRRLMPFSWKLPEPVRIALSKTLGVAWAAFRTATTRPLDIGRYPTHLGATTLGVFDIISPRWTTQHAPQEVLSWFQEESLAGRRVSACNYLGERPAV